MKDIKILEEFIKDYNASYPEEKEWVAIYPNQIEAIENLIKGYRELEEENRIFALAGSNIALKLHIEKNYISKSKIKEEIEKLKEMDLDCETFGSMRNYAVLILQDLLEDK